MSGDFKLGMALSLVVVVILWIQIHA